MVRSAESKLLDAGMANVLCYRDRFSRHALFKVIAIEPAGAVTAVNRLHHV